jgi:hypothetical protein
LALAISKESPAFALKPVGLEGEITAIVDVEEGDWTTGKWERKDPIQSKADTRCRTQDEGKTCKGMEREGLGRKTRGRGRVEELGYIISPNRRHPGWASFGPY